MGAQCLKPHRNCCPCHPYLPAGTTKGGKKQLMGVTTNTATPLLCLVGLPTQGCHCGSHHIDKTALSTRPLLLQIRFSFASPQLTAVCHCLGCPTSRTHLSHACCCPSLQQPVKKSSSFVVHTLPLSSAIKNLQGTCKKDACRVYLSGQGISMSLCCCWQQLLLCKRRHPWACYTAAPQQRTL